MELVLVTFGTRGDINPYIALGVALKKRGHAVTLISNATFSSLIQQAGLAFIPCGSVNDFLNTFQHKDASSAFKCLPLTGRHILLDTMQPLYEILSRFNPKQTLLISNLYAAGARIAQEKLGFPLISVCLQPASIWSVARPARLAFFPYFAHFPFFLKENLLRLVDWLIIDPIFSTQVNEFRAELGLPKINKILTQWLPSPELILGLFPPWFVDSAEDWPKHLQLTDFLMMDDPDYLLSQELLEFMENGEPPLVFTYGTAAMHAQQFFKTSIQVALKLGRKALLLTQYPQQLPTQLPAQIKHASYVPLKAVLKSAAVLIHHGGIGSATQAIAMGIPQLIVPFTYDQPDNAYWLEKLGLSVTLSPKSYTTSTVCNTLEQILSSSSTYALCQAYAKKINAYDGLHKTCDLIIDWVMHLTHRKPHLRWFQYERSHERQI